jgi:CheY-like chemotaxis protein
MRCLAVFSPIERSDLSVSNIEGLRLLVAEDDALVSILLEDMLAELGCAVVGAAANVPAALEIARTGGIDGAILDVNLGGESIDPVADELAARALPFLFVTGYGASGVPSRFAGAPVLQKPFQLPMLKQALALLGPARG